MVGVWMICIACTSLLPTRRTPPKNPSPAAWRSSWGAASAIWHRLWKREEFSMEAIDAAVAKVLKVKFQLGLFENPFVEEEYAVSTTNSVQHRALALETAQKAIVLLKNEGDLLPLDKSKLRSLAVIGPNAAALRLGGYSGIPNHRVTVLEGIQEKVGRRN